MSQSPSINTLAGATSGLREPDQSPARAAPAGPREPMQSKVVWCLIGLAGLLFVALFWEVIVRGARAAVDPDWAHILAAPAVALAYIAANRQRISEMPARLCWSGLVIMFVGLFSYLWWVFPGRNDMFRGYSLILTLFGMVLFTYGPGRMKVLWFPIAYLVFAVKIPDSIWEQVAFQLTLVAAAGSEISLEVCGKLFDYYIVKEGQAFTMMWTDDSGRLRQESFNIANACSGLRALMTFIALGVAMAFLWDRQWWQRIVMMAAAVPVALAVNIARVTSLGLLNLVNPAWAQGDSHVGVGMLWLVPGLIVFLGIGKLLDLMVIEPEGDERPDPREQRVLPGRVEFLTYASLLVGALVAVKLAGFLDGPVMGLTALPMSLIDLAIAAVVTAAIVFEVFRKPLERFAHRSVWKASAPIGDEPDEGVPARAIELVPVLLGGTVLALFVGGAYVLVLNGASGNPMFPALGPALSYVAAVVSIMGAIALMVGLRMKVMSIVGGLTLLVGVLATTAVGFQSAVRATEVALIKQPIEMRHTFFVLPKELGVADDGKGPRWVFAGDDPPLDKYIEDELGTDQYITRYYRDASVPEDSNEPGTVARVHLAYYTGMIDTVPHVPDRCWVAGGITSAGAESYVSELDLGESSPDPESDTLRVPTELADPADGKRFIRMPGASVPLRTFAGTDPMSGQTLRATYFFVANGGFYASANDVRLLGFSPRDRYSYYCKVEVSFPGLGDEEQTKERVAALLSDLLPEVMATLPDWTDVREGRWPTDGSDPAPQAETSRVDSP